MALSPSLSGGGSDECTSASSDEKDTKYPSPPKTPKKNREREKSSFLSRSRIYEIDDPKHGMLTWDQSPLCSKSNSSGFWVD